MGPGLGHEAEQDGGVEGGQELAEVAQGGAVLDALQGPDGGHVDGDGGGGAAGKGEALGLRVGDLALQGRNPGLDVGADLDGDPGYAPLQGGGGAGLGACDVQLGGRAET